ncbi:MAG: hypothetical protein H7301_03855 [Cryobacterium sp.]|nr:hypothetical protein [Oligoflexia bacterium]
MKNNIRNSAIGVIFLSGLSGCIGRGGYQSMSASISASLLSPVVSVSAVASLEIRNDSGQTIYQQSNPGSTLTLARGAVYRACLRSDNASVQITLKRSGNTFASGPTNQCYDLNLVGVSPGNYPLELSATASGNVPGSQRYTLAVTCAASEITAMSATDFVTGVSVSLRSPPANAYSYQPTGPRLSSADCAIDMNGDNIVDTEFVPCNQALNGYSNHVGSRNLRIYVREKTCNTTLTGSYAANLPFTVPNDAPFVNALVDSSRAAPGRYPALNLHHLTTGADNSLRLNCGYSNGVLTVQAYNRYDVRRGVGTHGMRITFGGLTGTLLNSNVATTPATQLTAYQFVTDQEIDLVGSDPIEFNGNSSNCRGTLTVENVDGAATCSDGSQVPQKTMWLRGNFGCSNLNDTANQSRINVGEGMNTMSGTYACSFVKADPCPTVGVGVGAGAGSGSGGGGGTAPGGGGSAPMAF